MGENMNESNYQTGKIELSYICFYVFFFFWGIPCIFLADMALCLGKFHVDVGRYD